MFRSTTDVNGEPIEEDVSLGGLVGEAGKKKKCALLVLIPAASSYVNSAKLFSRS